MATDRPFARIATAERAARMQRAALLTDVQLKNTDVTNPMVPHARSMRRAAAIAGGDKSPERPSAAMLNAETRTNQFPNL